MKEHVLLMLHSKHNISKGKRTFDLVKRYEYLIQGNSPCESKYLY